MFPGFVSLYRDNLNRVHVYFFRGIGDNEKPIYKILDLSHITEDYKFTKMQDGAIDYIFTNPFLSSITCKLVNINSGEIEEIHITI